MTISGEAIIVNEIQLLYHLANIAGRIEYTFPFAAAIFADHAIRHAFQRRHGQLWKDWCQHVRVMGFPGGGKTTLLLNMIAKQLAKGRSVFVLDPHGNLARQSVCMVPRVRLPLAIYHRPATAPLGVNPLNLTTGTEKEVEGVVDNVLSILQRLNRGGWGVIQDSMMKDAIQQALLLPNPTILDAIQIATDQTDDQGVKVRLEKLVDTPTLKKCMTAPTVDFLDLMKRGGCYFLDLSECGERTTDILYQLHLLRVWQAAMKKGEGGRGVFLVLDEAQRVSHSADALSRMLAELRKYRVSVALAHHFNDQLPKEVTRFYSQIGNQYLFRMTTEDARSSQHLVNPLEWERLTKLPNYQCVRMRQIRGYPERAHIHKTDAPPKPILSKAEVRVIMRQSRERYGHGMDHRKGRTNTPLPSRQTSGKPEPAPAPGVSELRDRPEAPEETRILGLPGESGALDEDRTQSMGVRVFALNDRAQGHSAVNGSANGRHS